MAKMQLDLFPMSYYNTLGFDRELIDYIDFVDDLFIYDLVLPLYKQGGRNPHDPVTMFRAHYLYFSKSDITSYRELERKLKAPQNQSYRNFISSGNSQPIPSHNSLSNFRAKVGIERFYQILFHIIAQAAKIDGFLNPVLSAVDSRPLFANVGGPKTKHCSCADKKSCSCEKTFTDPDAAVGAMRKKTNMNQFFVGYRKHTIVCHSKLGPVPLISLTLPADVHDVNVLLPLLQKLQQVEDLKLEYLVADLGYFDQDVNVEALAKHDVILTTDVKKNTVLPEDMNESLQFVCPQGHPLIWNSFNKDTLDIWFKGDENHCPDCFFNPTCDKYFHKNYLENPLINSPVPHGSQLHKKLQKFRKQVELNFAIESNSLDSVMRHKKLPVRGLQRVQIFTVMTDIFRLIKLMIKHMRAALKLKDRDELLNKMRIKSYTYPVGG